MGDLLINYLLLNSGKTSKLNEGTATDQKADILIASNIFHNMTFNIVISCIWINYNLCYIKYIIWAVSCLCRNDKLKEEHLKSVTPVTFWLTSVNSCWERALYILTMCYGRPLNPKVSVTAPEDLQKVGLTKWNARGCLQEPSSPWSYKSPKQTFCIGTDYFHRHGGNLSRSTADVSRCRCAAVNAVLSTAHLPLGIVIAKTVPLNLTAENSYEMQWNPTSFKRRKLTVWCGH